MAEVVDFEKFKRKKAVAAGEAADITADKKEEAEKPKRDPMITESYILAGLLFRKYPEDFGMGIVKKILELTKNFNPHTLEERREVVKKYSAHELVGWLTEHPESEWAEFPNFYRAIAEEAKFRFDYAAGR